MDRTRRLFRVFSLPALTVLVLATAGCDGAPRSTSQQITGDSPDRSGEAPVAQLAENDPARPPAQSRSTEAGGTSAMRTLESDGVSPPSHDGSRASSSTFIDRDAPNTVRLLCYNIKWNSIFPDVSAERAAKFRRLVAAIRPDVIALQEIGTHPGERERATNRSRNAEDVRLLMNEIAPLPGDASWQTFQGSDNVIASKYPLSLTANKLNPAGDRELAMALIDLPDANFSADLYLLNNHYKCCEPAQFDGRRQRQSDAIVAWLRDALLPGGNVELPRGTGFIVAGDLNIVGSFQPVTTLVTGDISDEQTYGADAPPDWDASPLTDSRPLHNQTGPGDWTWRDDNSQFAPGRLDYVIYSDSVLEAVESFALDTTSMTDSDLTAAGLEKFDVTHDNVGREYDHLPLVVDFRARR